MNRGDAPLSPTPALAAFPRFLAFQRGQAGFLTWNTDEDLAAAARSGSDDALSLLVHRHYGQVLSLCRRLTGDREAGEDLAQETFVRVIERLHQYRARARFRTWLFAVAVNLCRSHLRKTARERGRTVGAECRATEPGAADRCEDALAIRQAVGALPVMQRAVVVMRFYHDLNLEEIAQATGKSVSWAHQSLSRALTTLKDLLSDDQ